MLDGEPLAALVVAPHHDDEVIGCGGTMACLADQGHAVDVVYVTAGYCAHLGVADREEAIAFGEREAQAAGRILGVRRLHFLRQPDRDLVYSLTLVQELIRLIRAGRYDGLYFPHPRERDREHRVVNEVMNETTWLAASSCFLDLGDPWRIDHVRLYEVWTPLASVNYRNDISRYVERKIEALAAYRSKFTPKQAEQVVGLNYYRAAMSSRPKGAVEAFQAHTGETKG